MTSLRLQAIIDQASALAMLSPTRWTLILATGVAALPLILVQWKRFSRPPLPPGPPRLPILGNVLQIPAKEPWRVYKEWAKSYGDVMHLKAVGDTFIILNSLTAALDLLEQKAVFFSSRPRIISFDLIGLNWALGALGYGPKWRAARKAFHQHFNQHEIKSYRPITEQEGLIYLRRIAEHPEQFRQATRDFYGNVLMRISYGVNDVEYNRKLLRNAEAIVQCLSECILPGRFLVNVFPWLRHFPSWFPGTAWKKKFAEYSAASDLALVGSFNDAQERARKGYQSEFPNVATRLISEFPDEKDKDYQLQLDVARAVTADAFVAGSDTSVSSTYALYLALAMYPEVQRRAQKEIDTVVGSHRLPTYNDHARLPYLQAIIKEVFRWHTTVPLGLTHVSTEDYVYKGYFIPKGSNIMTNVWAIMHDPNVFEDPFEFKPERYLKNGQIDPTVLGPESAVFGFGRRICPGRHLGRDSLTYVAACLLALFDIKPPKNEAGNPVKLELKVTSELASSPQPFEVEIVPRSPQHLSLLRTE